MRCLSLRSAAGAAAAALATIQATPAPANDQGSPPPPGTLVFADDFEREEPRPDVEGIGRGWKTNSQRAGAKQADLDNGALHITRAPDAGHAAVVFHDAPFRDGTVAMRFRFRDAEGVLGIDLQDRKLKSVHAGHLGVVWIKPDRVVISDTKTGSMDKAVYQRRTSGNATPEDRALMKSKTKRFNTTIAPGEWHELAVAIDGDLLEVTVDGTVAGEFRSEGFAHPVKRTVSLQVGTEAWIDDFRVWARSQSRPRPAE